MLGCDEIGDRSNWQESIYLRRLRLSVFFFLFETVLRGDVLTQWSAMKFMGRREQLLGKEGGLCRLWNNDGHLLKRKIRDSSYVDRQRWNKMIRRKAYFLSKNLSIERILERCHRDGHMGKWYFIHNEPRTIVTHFPHHVSRSIYSRHRALKKTHYLLSVIPWSTWSCYIN